MNKIVQQVKSSVVTHMPGILTGVGIASFATSAICAATATPKVLAKIEAKKQEKQDNLEPVEIVQTAWKDYIPAIIMFGIGTGCTIAGLRVSERRSAAWATAYSLSETAFREYQDKMVEKLGERKEKKARDEIAQETVSKEEPEKRREGEGPEVAELPEGKVFCRDLTFGRTFAVDIDDVRDAEDYGIDECTSKKRKGSCSLNEIYRAMRVSDSEIGEDLGWNREHPLRKIERSSCLNDNGFPILAIRFTPVPRAEYWVYTDGSPVM